MASDCLLLTLPQGLDRQRVNGWRRQLFDLGEGEEQGYHRVATPAGEWHPDESLTVRGGPEATSVWFRAEFARPGWGERTVLRFDGAFLAVNVWLNGRLLGSHYGYPGSFGFDISSYLEATNIVAVCVQANGDPGHLPAPLSHLQDDGGLWWPLGVIGRVWLERTGNVIVQSLESNWHLTPGLAEASIKTALTNLDGREMQVTVGWQMLTPESDTPLVRWRRPARLRSGESINLETRVAVDRPQLWWPWTLGDQPLYTLVAQVEVDGRRSTVTTRRVGIREIDLEPSAGGMAWTINGRRHFPRGAVLPPLPPGESADPIGAWRLAGLDLALSRGQVPSDRTADSADSAGVLLVVDPPAFLAGEGDELAHRDHMKEAIGVIAPHASAAVLLQRTGGSPGDVMGGATAGDEPYFLSGAARAEVEAVRRAKFQPLTALVLRQLPDLDEAEGALAATTVLADWHRLAGGDAVRLRFHVINDDVATNGRGLVRWRLRALEPTGWLPFVRDRSGQVPVLIPAPDQPAAVYDAEVNMPADKGTMLLELGLEQEGELLSYLEYEIEPD
ncbi:MAG: sugar-binding domain-containing protein [Candidatus Dormiibacterota bacterium]